MSDKFRKGPLNSAKNKPTFSNPEDVKVAESDERKTVILDEELDNIELEDRVWLYWKRNKSFIVTTVVAAFAIVIGVQSWKMYNAAEKARLSDAYVAASTPEELAKFAADNSGTKLAGLAVLQNADSAFVAGKYSDAQKLYSDAAADLKGTVLAYRANIGAAMSLALGSDATKGADELENIFNAASTPQAYKAQAGFLLGILKLQAGKKDEAKKILTAVADNSQNGVFANLARQEVSNIK